MTKQTQNFQGELYVSLHEKKQQEHSRTVQKKEAKRFFKDFEKLDLNLQLFFIGVVRSTLPEYNPSETTIQIINEMIKVACNCSVFNFDRTKVVDFIKDIYINGTIKIK